jgi:exosome complex component RRP42
MNVQNEFVKRLAHKGERADARKFDEVRKIVIEARPIDKAEGSALVSLGKTKVIAGVKLEIGTPFPDKQDEGVLMSNAEFSPISSPDFEPGPPRDDSVELARVVDRGVRESKALDVKKLCIKEGEKVWMVNIDINILDNFGNLIDASALAASAALKNTVFPQVTKDNKVDVYAEKSKKKLPLTSVPIACTSFKVGGKMLIDANKDEEEASTARLTITTRDDGNVCAIQKGGSEGLTTEEVLWAIDTSIKRGKEIRKLIK